MLGLAYVLAVIMPALPEPDLGSEPDNPFAQDDQNKLVATVIGWT
jgi:hypothetical protein